MNTDNPKSTNIPNNSSSKGSDTNIPSYNSDGGRSLAAIYYDKRGNVTTLKEVTDFGTLQTTTITQPGSMDYPGGSSGNVFSYNSWGALEKDTGRGITSVTYDNLGNPQQISYSDQSYTRHVYSSSGDKLKSVHHSTPSLLSLAAMDGTATKAVSAAAGQETFEYRGQVIYRNGAVHMVLFPGGYATISGSTVTFHYYTQDYLGNNRAVVNGSTGAIEQTTAYYPYGGVIADLGSGNSGQPFKFGGKELVTANGLNEYDFGARRYYQAIPHFTSIDPLCEKYYWLSPYLYCANDPVNAIDPDGRSTWTRYLGNGKFEVIGGDLNDSDLNIYVYNQDNKGNYTIRGGSIGVSATMFSFYNSDFNDGEGKWMTQSVIDMNDISGKSFLSDLANNNPVLVSDYMTNAQNGGRYDFKETNGTSKKIPKIDHYRGMQIGKTTEGVPVLASARDVGNIGAGYMAAINGLSWNLARTGFDTYQSMVSHDETKEGLTTMTAEWYGYMIGRKSSTFMQRNYNLTRSIFDGMGTFMRKIFPFLH